MIRQLNQKTQRYLAIVIFLLIVIVVIGIFAVPVWKLNSYYSEIIDDMTHRLVILKRTTRDGQTLQPQYEKLRKYHLSDKRYLKSTSDAIAAAEIQKLIKEIIVPTDGEILSTQIISNNKKNTVIPQITLKVRMRSTLQSLVTIFHKIETGNPFLFIENLNVRSRVVNRRRRGRKAEQNTSPTKLDVQFDVSGYIRGIN